MKTRASKPLLFVAALACIGGASAASAQQMLPVKDSKAWKHKHSGISVPATLGGNIRSRAIAYAPDDLDVGLQFDAQNSNDSLSLYVYRNTNGNVALWFAQAQGAVKIRDAYHNPALAAPVRAFAPPGQTAASGLVATYAPGAGSAYRSTGVMLLPVGEFYVKVRASSQTRSPAELGAWMEQALAEIRWPSTIAPAAAAEPVADCPDRLTFDGTALAAGNAKIGGAQTRPARWCRDRIVEPMQTLYRPDGDAERYLLAVGDNGNAVIVGPELSIADPAEGKKPASPRFAIGLVTADRTANYVAQDRLPSPERAMEIIRANHKVSSVTTWDKDRNVELDSNAM
jgi:hypothetical protein